jgi:glycosyltransferase involved in cell wall biosynthesis
VHHVIDALGVGGGAEHSLATLLPRLRDRGIESTVTTLIPRAVPGLRAELVEQGFDVEILDATSWPGRVRALRRRVREVQPDVVHATLVNSCLVARFAGIGSDIPLVNSLVNTSYDPIRIQELGVPGWKLGIVRAVDGFTGRHLVDAFHAITETVRQEGIDVLGLDPAKIVVIPRGRAAQDLGDPGLARRERTRSALGIGPDADVVLAVGRQDHQKGHAGLVHAFARVRAARPDAVLLIAGRDGSATAELHEAIRTEGLEGSDAVRLLGHRTDVADLIAASDLFAFPSLYEGLGCSLIEAMALAVPIVGSDAPAVAEVIEHGHCGVVVPRAADEDLAEALGSLLADPDRRAELGRHGREEFLARYELDRVVDATVALYERVAAKH